MDCIVMERVAFMQRLPLIDRYRFASGIAMNCSAP